MKLLSSLLFKTTVAASVAGSLVLAGSKAQAFQIFTLSSNSHGSANPTRFGYVDFYTGAYTNVANLGTAAHRNLATYKNGFLTTRRTGANTELGSISRTGVFSLIGAANNIGTTVYGMSFSPTGQLVGYSFNTNQIGTINPASGGWNVLGPSGVTVLNNTSNPQGGRLAYHNDTLYAAARVAPNNPSSTRFASLGTNPTSFNTITNLNPLYQYMVLTSFQGTLYGLYSNGSSPTPATAPGIYSIDPDTGNTTFIRNITGFNTATTGYYLHGAAAVPGPLPVLGAAAIFGSVRRLRLSSKRLASLK